MDSLKDIIEKSLVHEPNGTTIFLGKVPSEKELTEIKKDYPDSKVKLNGKELRIKRL